MGSETVASIDFLKGGSSLGPSGASRLMADSSGNLSVSIDGAAATPVGGAGFGSDVIVQLANATPTLINALELTASLQVNTPGTENAQWKISLVNNGVLGDVATFFSSNAGTAFNLYFGPFANSTGLRIFTGPNRIDQQLNGTSFTTLTSAGLTMNTLRFQEGRQNAIASATTLTLGSGGNLIPITGTTTVNGITTTSWQAGTKIQLELVSGITITHNSGAPGGGAVAIQLRAGANLTTAKVYFLELIYNGTFWTQPD